MRTTSLALGLFIGAALVPQAHAGLYTDDLSRCLVEQTTKEDRSAMVQWMFTAMATHPAVASLAKVTPEQIEVANKTVGELFMRLLTDSCLEQSRKALVYEGPATIQLSFQVLGQVAAGELYANPEVLKAMSGLQKYTDPKKLEELMHQVEDPQHTPAD